MRTAYIGQVLLDALEQAPGGLQPKARLALVTIVKHLDHAEREIERQAARIAALEKIAHAPATQAIGQRL